MSIYKYYVYDTTKADFTTRITSLVRPDTHQAIANSLSEWILYLPVAEPLD